MTQQDHYHYGYGLEGYGPEGEATHAAASLIDLNDGVREELSQIEDQLRDGFSAFASEADKLRALRPNNGSNPPDFRGSWESIAEALQRAVDCIRQADTVAVLWSNLSPTRADSPLYRDRPDLWQETLQRLLIDSGDFPMRTQPDGSTMFYVWTCHESWCDWTHAGYPHEPGRLPDCRACDARCYCGDLERTTPCVHCASVEAGDYSCTNEDCEAASHD